MTWLVTLAALWGIVVAGVGAALTALGPWYAALRRPPWQPPDFMFGPIWTVVLTCAAAALVLGWQETADQPQRWRIIGAYVLNGALNIYWSALFFRQKRPDWALIEVLPLWLSISVMICTIAPFSTLGGWLLAPYVLWVTIAAVLNLAIVRLNQPFKAV